MYLLLMFQQAGLCEPEKPEGLLIALEPEAASIWCRKLRLNQLVPERNIDNLEMKQRLRPSGSSISSPLEQTGNKLVLEESTEGEFERKATFIDSGVFCGLLRLPVKPTSKMRKQKIQKFS